MRTKKETKKPLTHDPQGDVKALTVTVESASKDLITLPTSAEEVTLAVAQRTRLKEVSKDLEAKKKGITAPLNDALKKVRELFKPVEDRLEKAIDSVTLGLATYKRETEKALAAKQERLEARVEEGEITEQKAERILTKATVAAGACAIPVRTLTKVVIVDESKVPDLYWILDVVRIRRDALDGIKIPGVVLEEEEIVVTRKQ